MGMPGMMPEPPAVEEDPVPQEVQAPPPLFSPEIQAKVEQMYVGLAPAYSKKFGDLLQKKVDEWNEWTKRNGMRRQWCDNFSMYHNAGLSGDGGLFAESSFQIVGDNGELVEIRVNSLRNLITHLVNLTVSQPPAMLAKAANEDPDTLEAAQDLDGLLVYYQQTWNNRAFEKTVNLAVEQSGILPFGAVLVEWDTQAGKPYISDELGRIVREGDVSMKALSVFDVIFDTSIERETDLKWIIVRDWENKFELAARYPDQAKRILELPPRDRAEQNNAWGRSDNSDLVGVWKFYHLPTVAVPQGRFAISIDPETTLYDGPNPYDRLPVFFIRCADGHGTIYGYPVANDIVPLNLAENMMMSAMTTNYAAGGTQNIAVKAGDEPAVSAMAGGLRVLEYVDEPPQAISLVQNAPGSFDFLGLVRQTEELLSGINAAARGDPEANVKSGKMQGMLQALAVQFANKLQRNYAGTLNDIGNFLLFLFTRFATSERVTTLLGKDLVAKSLRWSGDKFRNISAVVVEQVDPAMRTLGFKLEQADKLLSTGTLTDPAAYVEVLKTGNLNAVLQRRMAQEKLIRDENSDLMRGLDCPVLVTDMHDLHIEAHDELLCSPKIRRDSALVQFILAHQTQHIQFKEALAMKAAPPPTDNKMQAPEEEQQSEPPMPDQAPASTPPPQEPQQVA